MCVCACVCVCVRESECRAVASSDSVPVLRTACQRTGSVCLRAARPALDIDLASGLVRGVIQRQTDRCSPSASYSNALPCKLLRSHN